MFVKRCRRRTPAGVSDITGCPEMTLFRITNLPSCNEHVLASVRYDFLIYVLRNENRFVDFAFRKSVERGHLGVSKTPVGVQKRRIFGNTNNVGGLT